MNYTKIYGYMEKHCVHPIPAILSKLTDDYYANFGIVTDRFRRDEHIS